MGHKLDEMKKSGSVKEISEIKKDLLKMLDAEIHSKGTNDLCAEELGEVTDMIKDLAEAEKCCMEACYYESVVEAMQDASDDDDEVMGYNNRRYASGRFAPKGRGRSMGYTPKPYLYDPDDEVPYQMRMGYGEPGRRNDMGESSYNNADDEEGGRSYGDYKRAKRHYTETKSPSDKREMNEKGMKHMNKAIWTLKEIWADADPDMRRQMHDALNGLVKEMPA